MGCEIKWVVGDDYMDELEDPYEVTLSDCEHEKEEPHCRRCNDWGCNDCLCCEY